MFNAVYDPVWSCKVLCSRSLQMGHGLPSSQGRRLSFCLLDTGVKVTCHLSPHLLDPLTVKREESVSSVWPLLYYVTGLARAGFDLMILVLRGPGLLLFNKYWLRDFIMQHGGAELLRTRLWSQQFWIQILPHSLTSCVTLFHCLISFLL